MLSDQGEVEYFWPHVSSQRAVKNIPLHLGHSTLLINALGSIYKSQRKALQIAQIHHIFEVDLRLFWAYI